MKVTSKQKRVNEIVELLLKGSERSTIVQKYSKKFKITNRQVDKYIKEAKVIAETRQKEKEIIEARVRASEIEKAAKEGILSDLEIEAILCRIVEGKHTTPEVVFIAGLPKTIKKSPSQSDITKAADLLFKKRGSYAPTKQDVNISTPPEIIIPGNDE